MTAMLEDARRFMSLLARPGDVFELRGLAKSDRGPSVMSGYFDDFDALVSAAGERSGKDTGVYVTLNPTVPALLARAEKNKLHRAGNGDTTSDRDVACRRALLVDVDPVRPQGISSSDEEHTGALALTSRIADDLRAAGWPEPIVADSGNGGHLIYAVDLPVDDGGLVKRVLEALSKKYSSPTLKIDEKVFNPSRISKIYGTLTRKGANVPDRPHRFARLISTPDVLAVVGRDVLETFATPAQRTNVQRDFKPSNGRKEFSLDDFISEHLPDAIEMNWSSGRKWLLPVCPFNGSHDRKEAFITQQNSGVIAAGCLHESCKWQWKELRKLFEPDAYTYEHQIPTNRDALGRKLTDREPPPEILYQDPAFYGDVGAFAARDDEPAISHPVITPAEITTEPPSRKARRARDVVADIWARKDEPLVEISLAGSSLLTLRAGGILLLIGGTGRGKSTLAIQMLVEHAKQHGCLSLAWTLELPDEEWVARGVGSRCASSWLDVLTGKVGPDRMVECLPEGLYIIDRSIPSIRDLEAEVAALRAESPHARILMAVDYVQLVQLGDPSKDVRIRIGDVMRELDAIARTHRAVIIALSQGSRASSRSLSSGERVGAETTDAGAESADLERWASATVAIGVLGEPQEGGQQHAELSIGKLRTGRGDLVFKALADLRIGRWELLDEGNTSSSVRNERGKKKQDDARDRVLGHLVQSGQPVFTRDLANVLGIRKQLVTDALRELHSEGLVEHDTTKTVRGHHPWVAVGKGGSS